MKNSKKGLIPYVVMGIIAVLVIIYTATLSASAKTEYSPSLEATRDGLLWEKSPDTMEFAWESDKEYKKIFSTPGTIIASDENGVYRLDSENGDVIWSYVRKNANICDVTEADGDVAILFNPGRGCTDVTVLNAATGQYKAQAQYATNSEIGALVYGRQNLAVVTPVSARLLRSDDLVPVSTFGDVPGEVYSDDQQVTGCNINDVTIGPESYAVSAKCEGDSTYKIRIIDNDPEESTKGEIIQTIDTNTNDHVSLPAMSSSMIFFVTTGASETDPMAYVWQLDKEYAEVASWRLPIYSYGYPYQDLRKFGYTWRVGEWVRYRPGSEDLSQGVDIYEATGDPMQAEDELLIPSYGGIKVVKFKEDGERKIKIKDFPHGSQYYAFSGRTLAALDPKTNKIMAFH